MPAKNAAFIFKLLAIPVLLLVFACGCSSFNRDWRCATVQTCPANSVEGPWDGTWLSDANGHHGKLRCLMTRETNDLYQARFHATFGRIFHFNYTAHFEMQPHNIIGWEFNGDANLGKLGGMYYYEGRATTTNLASTYKSKYDHGTFNLHRP